jgi:hypothetical protein
MRAKRTDRPRGVDYGLLDKRLGSRWKHRCFAPGCGSTCVQTGRRFQFCGGCKFAAYCSVTCQRRPWEYPQVPHWRLRKLLRQIRPVIKNCRDEAERYDALPAQVRKRCGEHAGWLAGKEEKKRRSPSSTSWSRPPMAAPDPGPGPCASPLSSRGPAVDESTNNNNEVEKPAIFLDPMMGATRTQTRRGIY